MPKNENDLGLTFAFKIPEKQFVMVQLLTLEGNVMARANQPLLQSLIFTELSLAPPPLVVKPEREGLFMMVEFIILRG